MIWLLKETADDYNLSMDMSVDDLVRQMRGGGNDIVVIGKGTR